MSRKRKDINKFWTWQNIRAIEVTSKAGDLTSARKLAVYHNQLVREANKRLRDLEAAGIKRYAYEKAMAYLEPMYGKGTKSYKLSTELRKDKTVNKDERYYLLRRDILSLQRFLSYETSTVEGVKRVELRRLDAAAERWFKSKDGLGYIAPREEIEEFLRLLGEDAIRKTLLEEASQELNGVQYTSGELVEMIRGRFLAGDKELILQAFEKFREEEETSRLRLNTPRTFQYNDLTKYLETGDKTKLNG